jgi:flagellar hook-associated protein 3 FlgL
MLSNQYLNGYNQSLSQLSDIQQKISTSKEINKPSDDPVRIVRGLQFSGSANSNKMFAQNANDAISWMKTSDSNIISIQNILSSIKTEVSKVISAGPADSYTTAANIIDKAIDELVQLGNADIGGRYIFGGQNDTAAPFTRNADGTVSYNGTYDGQLKNPALAFNATTNPYVATAGTITMTISPGAADPLRDKVNVDGQALFGTIDTTSTPPNQPQIFKDLLQIKQDVLAGATSATGNATVLTNDLSTIDAASDKIILAQSSIGARQSAYQTIQDRLVTDSLTIESDRSANEDLDVAKASIDLTKAQNVYSAVLGVGARILPKSLLDYM